MSYTTSQIKEKFGNKLVGKAKMKNQVILALQKLPSDIVSYVTENVWFVSSFDDAFGFVMTGEELQGKHLIFLSDDLFLEDQKQIEYTIIHEIGHVVLKHRNAILEAQSKAEIDKQEEQADQFASSHLKQK